MSNNARAIFSTTDPISGGNPFGGANATTDIFSGNSFLANPNNLSFFGTSSFYSGVNSDWNRIERTVSENAAAQEGTQLTSTLSENSRLGLGFQSELALPETMVESSEVESGIAEGEVVAGASVPWLAAAMINQQLGEATNQTMTAKTNESITNDYSQNLAQHGLNVGLNSAIIRDQQESINQSANAGGSFGALFGPIGALIGHAVAGTVAANPSLLNTANSFGGMYNPSDTNAVASATTADLSGESNLDVTAN